MYQDIADKYISGFELTINGAVRLSVSNIQLLHFLDEIAKKVLESPEINYGQWNTCFTSANSTIRNARTGSLEHLRARDSILEEE